MGNKRMEKEYKLVKQIDFSPAGTTQKITNRIAARFCKDSEIYHLLRRKITEPIVCGENELLVVGMPVYTGRIPQICIPNLRNLRGRNTPAIVVVVYGNREYEDALLELYDLLSEQGFIVVGAGAFIAQHSIFPNVAKGRPDQKDQEKIDLFSKKCMEKLQKNSINQFAPLQINGSYPYREWMNVPLKPMGSKKCNFCGSCVHVCPTRAINRDNPRMTDHKKCISCTACVQVCPTGARKFRGPIYRIAQIAFWKKYSQRKEPEWFL